MSTAQEIKKEALAFSDKERVPLINKYFHNFPDGYGYGDTFVAIRNPELRALARKYKEASIHEVFCLLEDKIHEIRQLALFILELIVKSKHLNPTDFNQIVAGYLQRLDYINNWDLVDTSAHHILGFSEYVQPTGVLEKLANENNLWHNRIAMIATFYHIRKNAYETPLHIAEILVNHKHDLIHKAVGWMLREIGKRDLAVEEKFLQKQYKKMPRTMLRYAIEKFDEPLRLAYLKGTV